MSGQEKLPPVRVWCQALPVPEGPDVVATARARRRAAAGATRAHLQALFPGLDPASLRRGPHGKPYLPPPWERFGFNPSDSGGWFLFGVVEGTGLGVDLERRRPRPRAMDLARRHFPAAEVDWLAAQADIEHAFLRLWTMKEALFKAIGRGLGYGLGRACFQPGTDGRLRLAHLDGEAAPAHRWSCAELPLGADLVGAAVWSGPARRVELNGPEHAFWTAMTDC